MRQFPAYTLTSLRAESVELLRLLAIEKAGRRDQPEEDPEEEV
jgi:hypothetical protein